MEAFRLSPPLSARGRTPRPLLASIACLALLAPVAALPVARADDTIRRVQEELRKRNLYFGDIDGHANRGIFGAVRRYQERKGFLVTGSLDETTLRSLNVSLPGTPDAPADPDPWPETPILKSDLARRPPPMGVVVTADRAEDDHTTPASSPTPGPAVDAGTAGRGGSALVMAHGTPQMAEANAASTPAESLPPDAPPAAGRLTPDAAREFLEDYLRDGSSNNLSAEMAHYGDRVDYLNEGPANREYIARDVRRYYRRWPTRRLELAGPVVLAAGPRPGQTTVRFQVQFAYRGNVGGKETHVGGRTENTFTLQGSRPGEVRIVGMREQRVRP